MKAHTPYPESPDRLRRRPNEQDDTRTPMERHRRNPKKQPDELLASASLPDDASRLVGSIVEKVKPFSPIPPPRPSLLPFPVARHRSHGPHWSPAKASGKDDPFHDYEDDDGEQQFMDPNSISSFAKPVQRKKKQELEFQRWKELLSTDDSGSSQKSARSIRVSSKVTKQSDDRQTLEYNGKRVLHESSVAALDATTSMEVDNENTLPGKTSGSLKGLPEARVDMGLVHPEFVADTDTSNTADNMQEECSRIPVRKERVSYNGTAKAYFNNAPASTITSSRLNGLGSRQASSSLESEIDVENRARLQRMSPEEIAEAQAEIMEKMDPALLNLLKKRGQDKLKKPRHSLLAASTSEKDINLVKAENQIITPDAHSRQNQTGTPSASKMIVNQKESSRFQNSDTAQGLSWDTWTQRVEAVRDLRFSLDGDAIIDDFVLATEAGDKRPNFESAVERDFLRTEGDPGAAGYTIKEAIALARSAVPGQRSLALHLLASVLDKALYNICKSRIGCMWKDEVKANISTDWEAVWAYALGPEPELVLALRMALDDNHSSVVLACARVILFLLSYDRNENFFDISEKMVIHGTDIFTAPVFRSKPEIDLGFLHGGYWKYSAKPSNILPSREEIVDDGTEDTYTIQDDVYVAGQDTAAGLVRMGILPRICYLLESEPTPVLEESIILILIAIARHSPTCTKAVLKCSRLVETIVKRFNLNTCMEVLPSQIKSVRLLKMLSLFDKGTCMEFVKNRSLDLVTWHLFQFTSSLDSWVKLGKEHCKLLSALMVEQLRLWKVYIQKGCCVSRYAELFPALCLWLSCPSFEKLMEKNLIFEFASMSKEAYLVLEALAGTLPNIYSQSSPANEAWEWRYVSPMIDTALSWISSASKFIEQKRANESSSSLIASLLWVYSAVMHTVSRVLEKITTNVEGEPLPWLPEFVPKIGLTIISHRLLSFCAVDGSRHANDSSGCSSFVEYLCYLRQKFKEEELSLASVSCLRGLIQTVVSIQSLIQSARSGMKTLPQEWISSRDESVLAKGILTESLAEIRALWNVFRDFIVSEWPLVQSVEVYRRGGPAPGVGLGWGATGGGFWSTGVLLAQADAYFLSLLLSISLVDTDVKTSEDWQLAVMMDKINSGLAVSLIAGPRDHILVEKTVHFVLQPHALEILARCIKSNKRFGAIEWEYSEENYLRMSNILASHFKHRWLQPKTKSKADNREPISQKPAASLETIHEESEMSDFSGQGRKSESLIVEWVRQRLPLPPHWFLSAISGVYSDKISPGLPESVDFLEVTKAGVFFLAGLESVSSLASHPSPVSSVPLVWKFHALSAVLLSGMDVLEDKTTGSLFESLQELYGQLLDEERLNYHQTQLLRFKSDIHENYSAFLETLVEQYAAVSYGDIVYGRQVSIYLHRCVEPSIRLAAWNVLSNAGVLELLPSLEKCLGQAEGYLEPAEDDEAVLEAYLKTWTSGGLDRAARRGSVAFELVLHQFSNLIFGSQGVENQQLRNKVVKSMLRDYSRKQQQREGMMLELLRSREAMEVDKRVEVLKEACEGNFSLVSQVEKLKSVLCGRR